MQPYIDQYQTGQLDVEPDYYPPFDPYNCDAKAGDDKGCGVNDVSGTSTALVGVLTRLEDEQHPVIWQRIQRYWRGGICL